MVFKKVISGESLAQRLRELGSEGDGTGDGDDAAMRTLHVTAAMETQKFAKSTKEWIDTCMRPDLLVGIAFHVQVTSYLITKNLEVSGLRGFEFRQRAAAARGEQRQFAITIAASRVHENETLRRLGLMVRDSATHEALQL